MSLEIQLEMTKLYKVFKKRNSPYLKATDKIYEYAYSVLPENKGSKMGTQA